MFIFGGSSSEETQRTNQESTGWQRGSQRGTAEGSQRIAEAGQTESDALSQLMQALYGNLQGASSLVTGGTQDAISTAMDEYNRIIEEGSKTALGVMSKTGMNSSIVNNMMGSMHKGAAGGLASTIMNLQANMPFQALNAVNSAASPLMGMLQGYFLNERGMNVDTTQRNQGYSSTGSGSESSGVSRGSQSGWNFGFQQ